MKPEPAPQDGSDLILRIKGGEKELFWRLAEPHYKSLYMTANAILHDGECDIAQSGSGGGRRARNHAEGVDPHRSA